MYCILIPENVWRPNLIFLKNLCRVHKKKHGELNFCRVPVVCRGLCLEAHGKMCVCRVPDVCREPFLLAHGKPSLCRVPDVLPTANFVAHGKHTFSGSVCQSILGISLYQVDQDCIRILPYLQERLLALQVMYTYIFCPKSQANCCGHNLRQEIPAQGQAVSIHNNLGIFILLFQLCQA